MAWKQAPRDMAAAAAVVILAGVAGAQCGYGWMPGGFRLGFDGSVYSSTVWDPDGAGPLPEWLVVGGTFTIAGNVPALRIAAFDGETWHDLGGADGTVKALTVHAGRLVAGGNFQQIGGVAASRIASFDGTAWAAHGSGFAHEVFALASFNAELYAGGRFPQTATTPANLARWRQGAWEQVGPGTSGWVYSFYTRPDELLIAGNFPLSRWDGSNWSVFPSGRYASVVGELGGDLCLGAEAVWRWDPPYWTQENYFFPSYKFGGTQILAMQEFNGSQYVAGDFVGALSRYQLGSALWSEAHGGLSGVGRTISVYRGSLVVGGSIRPWNGPAANGLARYDDNEWHSFGANISESSVRFLVPYRGGLVAVGHLFMTDDSGVSSEFATWHDGERWWAAPGAVAKVHSLDGGPQGAAVHEGRVIVVGMMQLPPTPSNTGVVAWDGESWAALPGLTYATAVASHQGQLIVAAFDSTGTPTTFRHEGGAWQAAGELPDRARTLFSSGTELYAGGGTYQSMQGSVSRWSGSAWHQLAPWPGLEVWTLAWHDGHLYAASGWESPSANLGVYRWNNLAWEAVGSGAIYPRGWTRGLVSRGGSLFALATVCDGDCEPFLFELRGDAWTSIPGSPHGGSPSLYAMAQVYGGLAIGGSFRRAGEHASPGVAFYRPASPACPANCDCSSSAPVLSAADFACFLQRFSAGDPYANCDGSTAAPALNIADFTCFLRRYAAGCP